MNPSPAFRRGLPTPDCGIVLHELRLGGPLKQPAHGIKEVASLGGCTGAAIPTGDDRCGVDLGERLVARCFDYVTEDVLALLAGCCSQGRPCGRLAVASNQPSQQSDRSLDRPRARCSGDCRLVFSVEFRRAECGANANARPFADADIPNGPAVPGDLPMQMWRACARHWRGLLEDDI